jgi:hypothetical protein
MAQGKSLQEMKNAMNKYVQSRQRNGNTVAVAKSAMETEKAAIEFIGEKMVDLRRTQLKFPDFRLVWDVVIRKKKVDPSSQYPVLFNKMITEARKDPNFNVIDAMNMFNDFLAAKEKGEPVRVLKRIKLGDPVPFEKWDHLQEAMGQKSSFAM